MKHLALVVCLVTGLPACGGGGGTITLPPTITSVTVMPATATVVTGKTATFTATVTGTGNYSPNVAWTASAGTISSTGILTAPASAGTVTVTATSTEDSTKSGTAAATIVFPLSVSVSATPATVNAGDTTGAALAATVQGGTGNATATWSVSPSTGAVTSTGSLTATYVPPATVSASTTVTITATATDASGSATGTVSVTVERVITIILNQTYPNQELYSDFGGAFPLSVSCTGCTNGDVFNVQSSYGGVTTATLAGGSLNFIGNGDIPGTVSFWITGTDGAKSNTLWLTFDGSQNMAVQDPSSGEIYYAYSGNGTEQSGSTFKFKSDGTADGSIEAGGNAIAVDGQTLYFTQPEPIASGINGISFTDVGNGSYGLIPLTNGEPLAIDAKGGLVCATIPTGGGSPNGTDAVDCDDSGGVFTVPGISSGSQPTAIRVLDPSHIVFYGRGDQTLRWYTISGTTATASGTLQLSEFTATDRNYWNTYPATGGWELVQVGSTLGVMGQVVNSDGTVSEKLALVNNTNQALIQYVDLPDGTVHITGDPTNNAIVAEYVDFSGASPVTRFERIYVDTGNTTLLMSTSNLVPGAGFLVTNDGSHIAVFVEGMADFVPNQ